MPRCRDCKLYDLQAVKSASGAVLSHKAARCLWKSTEQWPVSVSERTARPTPHMMPPNEDHRCQRFIKVHP
jgi:hypothetical protein